MENEMNAKELSKLTIVQSVGVLGTAALTETDTKNALRGMLGFGILVTSALTVMRLRDSMREEYGENWRKEKDAPGSFAARYPVLGVLFPIVSIVSGQRRE
jgi:hypothetical protein